MKDNSSPKIIAFCCNWCSYAGADAAGTSRLQIKPHFRVIRTMCSSRIDPELILESFKKGAWGVLVAGCHPGDCHYVNGNYKTQRRIALLKKLLDELGIESKRVRLEWISANEGGKFQKVINEFVDEIAALGPLKTEA
jgi:F420-non-reducing hydrogenase iron-sulfur subunit